MQQLGEIHHDLEVGGRRVGQDESRVLGGDARRHRLPVDAGDLLHQLLELGRPTRIAPALRHHVFQALLVLSGEADVALRLLLEGDADAVADELMAERARHAGDAEPEHHLLERGDVAGLQALLYELGDLLPRHGAGRDVVPHLAGRLRGVAGAVGPVELGEWVVRDVDEHDVHGALYRTRPGHRPLFFGVLSADGFSGQVRGRRRGRQEDGEGRALPFLALDHDASMVGLDDAVRD